jgi:hypothetical protein
MTQDFLGVEGAGDYMAKLDAKIQRIKEIYRKVKQGLMWNYPKYYIMT